MFQLFIYKIAIEQDAIWASGLQYSFLAANAIQNVHAEKHYIQRALRPCLPILGISGYACLEVQPGSIKKSQMMLMLKFLKVNHKTNLLETAMLECGINEVLSETEGPVVAGAIVESSEDISSSTAVEADPLASIPETSETKCQDKQRMPILLQTLMSHLS